MSFDDLDEQQQEAKVEPKTFQERIQGVLPYECTSAFGWPLRIIGCGSGYLRVVSLVCVWFDSVFYVLIDFQLHVLCCTALTAVLQPRLLSGLAIKQQQDNAVFGWGSACAWGVVWRCLGAVWQSFWPDPRVSTPFLLPSVILVLATGGHGYSRLLGWC